MKLCTILSGIIFFLFSLVPAKPLRIVIPYQIMGKTMVIQGKVNGQSGNLIFDTGIPKMLLNQKYVRRADVFWNKEFEGFRSVNGAIQNGGMNLVFLQLSEYSKKVAADVVNLDILEKQKGLKILGIVGIDLFRKYEIEIDGFSQVINLYRLDKEGNRKELCIQSEPTVVLSTKNQGHLVCIRATLNGMILQLGLDTGAEITVFTHQIFAKATYQSKELKYLKMLDLNGRLTTVSSAQISGLKIGTIEVSLPTLGIPFNTHCGDLDGKNIHGLLGFEFFQHVRTVINLKKGEVYVWKDSILEYPLLADN